MDFSEYDEMDLESLCELAPLLKNQLQKLSRDRNFVQLERDTIVTFSGVTKREAQEIKLLLEKKNIEVECAVKNHEMELKVRENIFVRDNRNLILFYHIYPGVSTKS